MPQGSQLPRRVDHPSGADALTTSARGGFCRIDDCAYSFKTQLVSCLGLAV